MCPRLCSLCLHPGSSFHLSPDHCNHLHGSITCLPRSPQLPTVPTLIVSLPLLRVSAGTYWLWNLAQPLPLASFPNMLLYMLHTPALLNLSLRSKHIVNANRHRPSPSSSSPSDRCLLLGRPLLPFFTTKKQKHDTPFYSMQMSPSPEAFLFPTCLLPL